jgi:hypothetical protein
MLRPPKVAKKMNYKNEIEAKSLRSVELYNSKQKKTLLRVDSDRGVPVGEKSIPDLE